MTRGEKLSSFGALDISATDVTLADLVSLGDMTVTGTNSIMILARNRGNVLQVDGTLLADIGVDFVAGGNFIFNRTPVMTGGGFTGVLANFASPNYGSDVNGTLYASFPVRIMDGPITAGDLRELGTNITLDLRAEGTPALNPADLGELAGAIMPMSTKLPIVNAKKNQDDDDEEGDDEAAGDEVSSLAPQEGVEEVSMANPATSGSGS